jgi:tryptophan synthase beta chain
VHLSHGESVRLKPDTTERPLFGRRDPDPRGYFGAYGGRFVPETLVAPIEELTAGYMAARADARFRDELDLLLKTYVGRPTPLYETRRLAGNRTVRVLLKREDLAHTGAHKINNSMGQALLARRMGKRRVVAETGAGQHGVATATACALLGLDCCVYMGAEDMRRQALNVVRMRLLGADVRQVDAGSRVLPGRCHASSSARLTCVRSAKAFTRIHTSARVTVSKPRMPNCSTA